METIKILPENKEQWLQHRKKFIGGSEMGAILGLNEWMSPYDVWLNKTDRQEPFEDNKHTLAGKFLEDGVARYWEHETGHVIIKASKKDVLYIHPEHRIGGTPDRLFWWEGSHKEKAVLEVKTTMKIVDVADVPRSWFIQPLLYCGLLNLKRFVIVWFEFLTKELKWQEFEFNQELFDSFCQAADVFWDTYIIPDTPPPAQTEADLKRLFPKSTDRPLIANNEVMDLYSEMISVKRQIKPLEKMYKDLALQVKLIMKDADIVYSEQMDKLFTYRTGKKARVFKIYEI